MLAIIQMNVISAGHHPDIHDCFIRIYFHLVIPHW